MKKYFIAACCLVSMAAITQACNESEKFDTSTFQALCNATGGVIQDGDEDHCYCSNIQCEGGVVCDNDKKCMSSKFPENPAPRPQQPSGEPECNAQTNGQSFCIISSGTATMATCNGSAFVASPNGVCASTKCKADHSACEEVENPNNGPVCDASHNGDKLCEIVDGNAVIKECNGTDYIASSETCASNKCDADGKACLIEEDNTEESDCNAQNVTKVICVEDDGEAHLEMCVEIPAEEDGGESSFAYKAVEENGICESNKCNEDNDACFIEEETNEYACTVEKLNDTICEIVDNNAVIRKCNGTEYAIVNEACLSNKCDTDGKACLIEVVEEGPVCDASVLNDIICVEGEDEAHLEICSGNETDGYNFIAVEADGICASKKCNEAKDDCLEVEAPVSPTCTSENVNQEICVEDDGSAKIMVCSEIAGEETSYNFVDKENGACESSACNDDHSACKEISGQD